MVNYERGRKARALQASRDAGLVRTSNPKLANRVGTVRAALRGMIAARTPIVGLNPRTQYRITSDTGAEISYREVDALIATCKAAVTGVGGSEKTFVKGNNNSNVFSFTPNGSATGSRVFGYRLKVSASPLYFDEKPVTVIVGQGVSTATATGSISAVQLQFELWAEKGGPAEVILLSTQKSGGRLNVSTGLIGNGIADGSNSAGINCLQVSSNSNANIQVTLESLNERDLGAHTLIRDGAVSNDMMADMLGDYDLLDLEGDGIFVSAGF